MPKRILFVVNHAGFFLSHRLPIAQAARQAGYDVHIATPKSKHVSRIIDAGLSWHEIHLSRSGRNPFAELRTLLDLIRLYRRLRPNLVHHVTSKPVMYGTIAARLTRVPAVVNAVSGTGHLFVSGGMLRGAQRSLLGVVYRLSQRHPRMRVIFQNMDQLREFTGRGWMRQGDAVLIPGSGVDLATFQPAESERNVPVVAMATRMLFSKGVGDFVEASRRLRARGVAAHFLLLGEPDPDNPDSIPADLLRRWASEGVVEAPGRIEDMAGAFKGIDILALPTFYGEGVPKVLIEAAACGIPAVTTDWPGCRDIVLDGKTGILVPPRDIDSLAAALQKLIENPELRREMGSRARVLAADFSLDVVIRKTVALYNELIE